MSTNQLTVEKRPEQKKIMKSGNQGIEVDLPKPQNRVNEFNPQKVKFSDQEQEYEKQILSQHHIEKPKQQKEKLFDQHYPAKNNPQPDVVTIKPREEKRIQNQEEKEPIKIEKPCYSIEELKRSAPPENSNPFFLKTRGYILLKNYLKEMHDCGMTNNFNSKNYQIMKNLQNNNATLLDSGKDSFVPTILKKNVNEWDENSELAFEMDTKTILNRLTPQNIDESIRELLPKIDNNDERLDFMIRTLIQKASTEKSFSHVYADFVKHLSYEDGDEDLAERIIQFAEEDFNNCILNASSDNSDNESEIYIGCATFIANLIKNGALKRGKFYLSQLIDYLPVEEEKPLNTHIIEMLFNFIKSVGDDFIQENSLQLQIIDEVLKNRKKIKSLHRFILIDTLEIINSVINKFDDNNSDINAKNSGSNEKRNIDEFKSICRNGFASYQGDYTNVPACVSNMKSVDFLEGTMLLFQDMKDIYDFTYYQCFVLNNLQFQLNDIVNLLIKYVNIFTEQKVIIDCPSIWQNFSQILCQMIIHSIIRIDDAKRIQSEIFRLNSPKDKDGKYPVNNYDPINDLKYFIDDNFDFSESIEFKSTNYPSPEINFALKLPSVINDTNLNIPEFTRIITVAVIRSIFYKFVNESEDQSVNGLQKWKKLLNEVYSKRPKLFSDEVNYEIDAFGLDMQYDDIVQFISQ